MCSRIPEPPCSAPLVGTYTRLIYMCRSRRLTALILGRRVTIPAPLSHFHYMCTLTGFAGEEGKVGETFIFHGLLLCHRMHRDGCGQECELVERAGAGGPLCQKKSSCTCATYPILKLCVSLSAMVVVPKKVHSLSLSLWSQHAPLPWQYFLLFFHSNVPLLNVPHFLVLTDRGRTFPPLFLA